MLPQASCNGSNTANMLSTFTAALSNTTYIHTLNRLFGKCRFSPLHSLLSSAATEILGSSSGEISTPDCAPLIRFKGFDTVPERLYVVVIVTLLSTTTVFAVMVLSMCYEDRCMKVEDKTMKMKVKKSQDMTEGPSLLTPIAEREFASSYSSFHQLRKKHMQSGHKLRTGTPPASSDVRYVLLPSEPGSPLPSNGVTGSPVHESRTGVTVTSADTSLADLSES